MSDQFGFLEGAKTFSSNLDASRSTAKELSKSIENIQAEANDVAKKQDADRRRKIKETQIFKEQYFKRALIEWQRQESIRIEEAKTKADFVKKHGVKRWTEIETIKQKIERQDNELSKEFKEDLAKVRRAMFMCYAVATIIAWYLTWGYKQ